MILEDNDVSTVNTYITNGWIVAYDGNSTVNVDYNSTTNLTTLTAAPLGQQVWFILASGTEGTWDDANNWTARKPLAVDTANHNKSVKTCTISSGTTAVCAHIWLPYWQADVNKPVHLLMVGGELYIHKNFVIDRCGKNDNATPKPKTFIDTGILDLQAGAITVDHNLSVGGRGNDWGTNTGGTGTIKMAGGTIN